jgi:hypothetical protein
MFSKQEILFLRLDLREKSRFPQQYADLVQENLFQILPNKFFAGFCCPNCTYRSMGFHEISNHLLPGADRFQFEAMEMETDPNFPPLCIGEKKVASLRACSTYSN